MFQFTELPPLSLYIHFPWCERKCPYCDFNSHQPRSTVPERAYVDALLRDLADDLPRVWGRAVQTVFIGGGTPSLLSVEAVDQLLSGLRALLALRPDAEITLEANPGSAEQARFAEYRAAGINRLSVGVQSFSDDSLQRLGRIHGRCEAIAAAEMAHAAGFDNLNLDLMFALPAQDPAQAAEDVATAIALEPTHISYYQLTLEPNTRFFTQPPRLPDDDSAWRIQQQGQTLLAEAGYGQYEVSAYAREGRRCAHNINYWQFGDYLGIGAGAHAKLSDAAQQNITRLAKRRGPQDYLDADRVTQRIQSEHTITRSEVGLEFMMNALRLTEGFAPPLFAAHTGQPLTLVETPLRMAEEKGLLDWSVDNIRASKKGRLFLDDLLGIFTDLEKGR
ncbi:Radical SAM family enzyme, similar to coproporphyrinogen III oxidase, oxygen-independent, clustered with nucleoside-triphosphatase RdgB [hydrothermal vent metagenome]|uniref:Radical SAM family enzyme, similar to coproporphyrinogen III oxidase, oxygen-independent, clustered with nucleoside-triphosphatase RdgB n=1 Tax=hydrothermal vent metagenome TaxID=652676 RepID=A0A3B1AN09_9ZZZZ